MATIDLSRLRKFVAPEFVFGPGSRFLAGRYARNFGAVKVLVVSDPGVVAAGWADQIASNLDESGLEFVLFSSVSPNPRAEEVMAGAALYKAETCDVIVAIGGGSAIDCAKGIGIVSSNRKLVTAFEGIDRVDSPGPPLVCIPTTAGTSADVSQFAIITNRIERRKFAIISKTVVPDVSLIDPETTRTMSPWLAACTGLDALVHAIEAFVSLAHSPIADLHALEAIRLIRSNLQAVLDDAEDDAAREALMLGSLQAGLAFSNTSLGAVHAMAHSLGGYLDLPHGECNAILLPHVMAFNFDCSSERYRKIGEAMGLDLRGRSPSQAGSAILAEVDRLKIASGVHDGLAAHGVSPADVRFLAENAMVDPCMVTNPRRPERRDIEVVYEEAM